MAGRYDEAEVKWRFVERLTTDRMLRAHVTMGLGNIALAQQQYRSACSSFAKAFTLYADIPDCETEVIGALNNCLYSCVMEQDWAAADRWRSVAHDYSHVDNPQAWGEFANTQAEMAWKQGCSKQSKEFLNKAFHLLDDRMCRSWFTARLLDAEISLTEGQVANACNRFDQILSRIEYVPDVTLRVSVILRAINIGLRTNGRFGSSLDERMRQFQVINITRLY
ncbi:hypothetical protein [Sulfobacillus thermosulfidooxidans]|uniref:hypothetical protein n=1 Tax=Sulfobacillus thermosulfidooxidans TaxID=28034 RepID=UPI000371C929|nr:hypothetical protein [Sulfobacillus thermosulfidooxidans]